MITEIPTAEEFSEAGASLLYLAWEIVMELVRGTDELHTGVPLDEAMTEEYWQASQSALGNAFSLIQQSMELGIKGRIAAISPFLLISTEHSKWGNQPFSDFRTIDATDLVRVHNAISSDQLDDKFRAFFDAVRRQRNKLMHSVQRDAFEAKTLIVNVLTAAETLYGEMKWPQHCIKLESNSRISVLTGGDTERNRVMTDAKLMLEYLTPALAKRFIGIDKKRRSYLCLDCYDAADHDWADDYPMLAQLASKEPEETKLHCFVCGTTSDVIRHKCASCEGSVLSDEGVCLTCRDVNSVD